MATVNIWVCYACGQEASNHLSKDEMPPHCPRCCKEMVSRSITKSDAVGQSKNIILFSP